MLYSLLSGSFLVLDLLKLDVNPDDPYGKYQSKDGLLYTTVNSGAWYQQACNNLANDPSKAFVHPICFACDETKVAKTFKTSSWPALLSSMALFKQTLHNHSTAWSPLGGYLYDLNMLDSKARKGRQTKEYKGEMCHSILCMLLET
jgi:hypothetical protein